MCSVTLTEDWRIFFKSIENDQFKMLEGCVVLRQDDFDTLCNLAHIKQTPGVDRCLGKASKKKRAV
jgi:hypothetical protein